MAENANQSPVMFRRRLRAELRRARSDAGLTQDQVAQEMDWSLSKVIRIEKGTSNISKNDLEAVFRLYKITDPRRESELIELSRAARKPSWWSSYKDIAPNELIEFVEYESAASVIWNFEPQLIPGLLQTEDYARAAIRRFSVGRDVDKLVELRMRRHEILGRDDAPSLNIVIIEEVAHRGVGGKDIMLAQLRHLIDLAGRPDVTIEVIPYQAGVHPGMHSPFVIHQYEEERDDDVLYVESPLGDLIIRDNEKEIGSYRDRFQDLRDLSLGPDASSTFLAEIAGQLK